MTQSLELLTDKNWSIGLPLRSKPKLKVIVPFDQDVISQQTSKKSSIGTTLISRFQETTYRERVKLDPNPALFAVTGPSGRLSTKEEQLNELNQTMDALLEKKYTTGYLTLLEKLKLIGVKKNTDKLLGLEEPSLEDRLRLDRLELLLDQGHELIEKIDKKLQQ